MTDCNFALASAIFAVIAHKPVLNQSLVMVKLGVKFKYIAGCFFTFIFKAACALYPFFRKAIFIIYAYARRISVSPVCFGNIARISVKPVTNKSDKRDTPKIRAIILLFISPFFFICGENPWH